MKNGELLQILMDALPDPGDVTNVFFLNEGIEVKWKGLVVRVRPHCDDRDNFPTVRTTKGRRRKTWEAGPVAKLIQKAMRDRMTDDL